MRMVQRQFGVSPLAAIIIIRSEQHLWSVASGRHG